ncbi:general secretion pathway protein GspK [Pseudomonas qingdaonensis]|uniref:General secretion pathway protein GspK n=1 Tax=Pseudomonas qingdaonensis TaxID=2056231 RepID=A0ABX8DRU2_9PSED|nr:type II secretion system protein GspK [Pseudomonas qingdaonensis]QVL18976.1 general secretion pathway protein GspK [Pseudomonas qingdaonensis]
MLIGFTRQRGMALTLVIWLLAAISMFVTGVVATHRVESRQNHAELQRSKAVVAAEGGLSLAVYEMLQNPDRYIANGQTHPVTLDGVTLAVSVRSEHGKLDLNFGNLDYFARFFHVMGTSSEEANALVSQMRMRRDQGEPLQHLEDLLVVTSMDTALYQRILPYVTLWGGDGVPAAAFADQVLSKAIGLPKAQQYNSNPGSVVSIDVQAILADGFTAGLLATVQITPEDSEAGIFKVLHWQER